MHELKGNMHRCPHCKKTQSKKAALYHLQPGTILGNEYEIGACLYEDSFTLMYIAREIQTSKIVWLEEFYPAFLCTRINTHTSYVSLQHTTDNEAYSALGQNYVRVLRTLQENNQLTNTFVPEHLVDANLSAYAIYKKMRGQSLRSYIHSNKTLTLGETLYLLKPIMKDLYILHKKGIVHSRITPERIHIHKGEAYLSGFGIDLRNEWVSRQAAPFAYEEGFYAPEQIRSSHPLQPQTDIYALAAVIYFCLSGQAPVQASDRLFKDGLDVSLLSKPVGKTIKKGLSLSVQDRYASVDLFLADLLAAQEEEELLQKKQDEKDAALIVPSTHFKNPIRAMGLALVGISLLMSSANYLYYKDKIPATSPSEGIYENGVLSWQLLEYLQAVDTETVTLRECDFKSLESDKLSENPIVTSLIIEEPSNLSDLSFLAAYPNLRELHIEKAHVSDAMIKTLDWSKMSEMQQLYLNGNALTSLEFCASMPNLQEVYLQNNRIESMEGLKNLAYLNKVNLANNKISTFVPLNSYSDAALSLQNNPLTSIEEHDGVYNTYYSYLNISQNDLFDQEYEDYAALLSLQGDVLVASYDYKDAHLDEDGTELALYTLVYAGFLDVNVLECDTQSQEWLASYFGEKTYSIIDKSEVELFNKDYLG
jgi:serine/threonine protein kinase